MSGEGERVRRILEEAIALHERIKGFPDPTIRAAVRMAEALRAGGKVLMFGNGGSAADAEHAAAELVGRFQRERRGLAAIALTANSSVLTSVSNDYGFERAFARQIEALGRPGDVAFAISTSGVSANVVSGLDEAHKGGLGTIALTGCDGGPVGRVAEIHVNVPSTSTARVQEVHRTLLHVICELVEEALT